MEGALIGGVIFGLIIVGLGMMLWSGYKEDQKKWKQ